MAKILYLSSSLIPSTAANSVHVMKMAEAFSNAGHNISLVARKGDSTSELKNLYERYGVKDVFNLILINTYKKRFAPLLYLSKVLRVILREDKDSIIYGRHIFSILLAAFLKRKFVYESHNFNTRYSHRIAEKFIFSRKHILRVNVISNALKEVYLKEYPHIKDVIHVLHDGAIEVDDSTPAITYVFKNKQKALTVGYAGQLYPGKGIEIISQLSYKLPNINFCIVGGNKDLIDYWKKECSEENVIFTGFINPADVPGYLKGFDIVLAPYQRTVTVAGGGDVSKYMSPLKIFEYLSASKPIICSRLPVLEEVLTNRITTLFCEPDSIEEWVAAVQELTGSSELREFLSKNGKELFLTGYSWDARAKKAI